LQREGPIVARASVHRPRPRDGAAREGSSTLARHIPGEVAEWLKALAC
jgi:hypothetical protein